jgi:hypothetical protein
MRVEMPRGKKAKPVERKRGRPSKYSEEITDVICEEIALGRALHKLCEERDDFPGEATVYRWLEEHSNFREKYIRARERQAERRAEELILIADTEKDAAVARNMIDVRKWAAAKLLPKKYGDRTTTEITGANGAPIQLEAKRTIKLENMDDETLEQIEHALRLALENKSD